MKVITFGRNSNNTVEIYDKTVSSNHLQIAKLNNGKYEIIDIGSKNGTFVNGKKIEYALIEEDDIVRIGNTVLKWAKYFDDNNFKDVFSEKETTNNLPKTNKKSQITNKEESSINKEKNNIKIEIKTNENENKTKIKLREEIPEKNIENLIYANFWLRFLATFIDLLLLSIVFFLIILAIGLSVTLSTTTFYLISLAISVIISFFYFVLFESSEQQATFGKKALNIKVSDHKHNKISFGKATARYFLKYLSVLILFIGFFMSLWTEKKLCLHDIICKTIVTIDK